MTTACAPSPFARAVTTYSCCITSKNDERVWRISTAVMPVLSVKAGMIIRRRLAPRSSVGGM